MADHPFPAISNPQITTTGMYAGDIIINLRELLTDIDLSPLFEGWRPIIKTQFLFRSGKIAMTDPDLSNEVHIVVDDFINHTGNVNLHIPFFSDDDDTLVLENHPTILNNKVLGAGISTSDDIDFNGNSILEAVIDGASNTFLNIPKTGLPSTTVYTDQANVYGTFNQTYRSGYLRITNPANTFNYSIVGGALTGSYNVSLPVISAHDTFALKGIDNVFTESQTIQKATNSALLALYNSTNTAGNDMLLGFDAQSSTGVRRTYAEIFGTIVTNTNGAENGTIYFNIMSNGTLGTKFAVNHNGYLYLGANTRVLLNDTGLSTQRIFTFPDVAGQLAVNNNANVFTDKQRISYSAGADALILNRDSNALSTLTGIYFKADDSANNETTYTYMTGGIGSVTGDNTDGAENGQFYLGLKVAGVDVTKLNITKNRLNAYGVVPVFEAPSSDLNTMFIYRPVNTSGSNVIAFQLQNSVNAVKQYGSIGVRSETVTSGSEVGSVQLSATEAGTTQLQVKIQSYQTWLYNSSSLAAILDPTGLSSNRVYTFPDQAGQITLNAATQILSNKTVSGGWTISGDVTVNNALGLHITKNAGSSVAEVLMRLDMADNPTSYFQVDNATTLDTQFVPRITTYHSSAGSAAPALYVYSNILGANDTGTTNAAIVLDGRRVDGGGASLTSRPILDIRNFTTNLFRVFPTYVASHLPVTISPTSGTGDFETLMTLQPSDSPSCSMVFQNGTSTNTVFTPLFTTQVLAAAAASTHTNVYFRNIILPANDTGSIALMSVEGRRSDVTAITTRPIFSIKNLNTDLYLFYPTHLDLTNHFIEIEEIAAPSNPPANHLRIWMDNGDETLKIKNSAGTVTTVGTGGATAIDQLTDVDTSTVAPTNNQVLTWDGTNWVPATPPGASGGEANLGANVGSGTGLLFRDKTGVTLNFKSILAGNGISVTNNTNDVTLALGTSITLPSVQNSMITWTKPNSGATGAERLMGWTVDDDPNGSILTIENLTGNENIFAPGLIFSQYSSAIIPSSIIIGRIADANDVVNTTPVVSLNARRNTAAITNRPLFGVQTYSDAYDFMVYKDKIDFGGNSLQNGVVSSSITGIVDANIDAHTTTKITIANKALLPSTIAYEDEANTFSSQQIFTADQFNPILIRRPTNVAGNTAGLHIQLRDSGGNNQDYARIEARIGTNTNGSETGFLDFYTIKNGTMGQYMILDGNQLSLGLSGARVVLDASNINTVSKTFNFPNLSGQLVTQEFANVFSAIQKVSVDSANPLVVTRPINTQFATVGINFNANDSLGVEHTYGYVFASLEDTTDGSKDSYIGFQYRVGNSLVRRAAFYNNSLYLGVMGNQALITTSGLTADRTFTFPNLSGQLATQENANIFTAAQTIAAGVGYPIVLYRNTTSTGLGVAISFDLDNSNNSQRQYAAIVGNVIVSTAGAESGALNFQTRSSGTLGTRMQLNHVGNLFIGSNLRLVLTESGLTAQRIISFPNGDTKLLGETTGLKVKRDEITTTPVTATNMQTNLNVDASAANRTVNLPAVSGNDGLIYIIRKIDSSSNTVTIDADGTETINGSSTLVLTAQYQTVMLVANTSGTGSHWYTQPYSVERRGKSTASGNGSAVTFNVPHGLGVNPHDALIQCSSHTIAFTYATDATNIVVTFASAPPSGTNNVIFHWSAVQ